MSLKVGDRVFIDGTREEGTVKGVHPHEIVVRVKVAGGHEDRKYAHEDLRLDPTLDPLRGEPAFQKLITEAEAIEQASSRSPSAKVP